MLTTISLNDFYNTKETIDEFYKVRKEIFVDRLKWELPIQDGKEIDQFDHNNCHYLVASHQDKIIGGTRLTASIYPNLTFDFFQNHLTFLNAIERSSDLLEVSRFGIKQIPQLESTSILKTKTLELLEGIFKFALDNNYKNIIAVTETRIERILKFIGLPIHHISETKQYGGVQVFIGVIEITRERYLHLNALRLKLCNL